MCVNDFLQLAVVGVGSLGCDGVAHLPRDFLSLTQVRKGRKGMILYIGGELGAHSLHLAGGEQASLPAGANRIVGCVL